MLRGASTLLMVVAAATIVAFMYWLDRKTASLETDVTPVLEQDTEGVESIELATATLAADPAAAVGRTGWLRGIPVDERLGRGAFSVQLDSASAFPVLLSADLIQMDTQVYAGDVVTLYGHVFTLNDSIRSEWVAQQAVDEEHATAIPLTPSFMFADSLSFN